MILRHVETLRDLGFDAHCYVGVGSQAPQWLAHRAPLELATPLRPDDIVVLPDDADDAMRTMAAADQRTVVFSQNPYNLAAKTVADLERFPAARFPPFIAVSPGLAATLRRLYPAAQVEVVRCFADERVFRPGLGARQGVVIVPRKRPLEAAAIRNLFHRLHPEHAALAWTQLAGATEAAVAAALQRSALHLSLSRLESVGMTTLEAMASGCLCAGFLGVGGREYATAENGFWVADDDCEAAADALAEAADVARSGGAALERPLEAGYETARQWSYAAFRPELEAAWMRLAPDARVRNGPLD
jgi:hypothetical protein